MNYTITWIIKNITSLSTFFGLGLSRIIFFRHYPKYLANYNEYRRLGGVVTHRKIILNDYYDQAGSASGHYFHQDLLVASFIHKKNPARHIDIGSRIDGFVAHVASFRSIEVLDMRDLDLIAHSNITFVKADMMKKDSGQESIADSISCLHAIEHFGLGRYGDPIDPKGHIKGFNNILRMLRPNGTLYISFPIGRKNEVHFNAHRVFHPKDIFTWAEFNNIGLERFDYVDDEGQLHRNINLNNVEVNLIYGCGIYTFRKILLSN